MACNKSKSLINGSQTTALDGAQSTEEDIPQNSLEYGVTVVLTAAATMTSFDANIETSDDQLTWYDIGSIAQLTANGSAISALDASMPVLKFVRANSTFVGAGSANVVLKLHYREDEKAR
jgi:hypothetical protein